MTVEEAGKIDMMGLDKKTGVAVLGISDHLQWDEVDHIPCLERKIGSYLDFIQSGQLFEMLPTAKTPVRIELIYLHELTDTAERILQVGQQQLAEMGITFRYFSTRQTA